MRFALACFLIAFFSAMTFTYAQDGAVEPANTRYPWPIAPNLCGVSEPCYIDFRVDQNNVLYMLSDDGIMSYQPDGVTAQEHFVPPGNFTGADFDFEPLGNGFVAFFGLASAGYQFFLYDLQTEVLNSVTFPIQFVACNINQFPRGRSFIRLGTGATIVACSHSSNGYGLHIVDLNAQNIIESIYVSTTGGYDPQDRIGIVIGGLDGNIYVQSGGGNLLRQLFPNFDSIRFSSTFVLKYVPQSGQWTAVQIARDQITRTTLDPLNTSNIRLLGVDHVGNLYFYKNWLDDNNIRRVDISKFTPDGEQVWFVTEEHLGEVPSNVSLIHENDLLIFFGFSSGIVSAYTVVGTPNIAP